MILTFKVFWHFSTFSSCYLAWLVGLSCILNGSIAFFQVILGFMLDIWVKFYLWALSSTGKFNNVVDEDKNEKLGIYDAGDSAVNECLKKKQQANKDGIFISQSDYDIYKVHFGSLTVYRFSLKCKCNNLPSSKRCSKFLPMSQQGWGGYMGTLNNGYFVPRKGT